MQDNQLNVTNSMFKKNK